MLIVFFLVLVGMKNRKMTTENWFGKEECVSLRGVAAIYIMLSHIHMFSSFKSPWTWILYPVNQGTILANGLFFFISGYGLWESKKTKKEYLSFRSLLGRLLKLCVPAYLVYFLYFFIRKVMENGEISFIKHLLLSEVISWFYYDDVVWFIIELFFLYIIFWITYRFKSITIGNIILITIIGLWTILAVYTSRGIVWYASTFCFALGIVVSQQHRFIQTNLMKYYQYVIGIIFLCFAAVFLLYCMAANDLGLRTAVYANFSTLLFCTLCYLVLYNFSIGNSVTNWIGRFSYEIYLSNMMVIKVIKELISNDVLRIYSSIVLTLFVAFLINIVDSRILLFANNIIKKFFAGRVHE